MIASIAVRLALFVPTVFCAMVVYAGLREETARGCVRTGTRKTVKVMVWTAVIVAVMFALEWLFID